MQGELTVRTSGLLQRAQRIEISEFECFNHLRAQML